VILLASLFVLAGGSMLLASAASASAPIAAPVPPVPPAAPAPVVTPVPPLPPVPPVPPTCACHSTTAPPTIAPTSPVVVPPTVPPANPPVLAETGTDHSTAIIVSALMIVSGCALLVVARQPRRGHAI
jgi:homeobox protein ESX1